MKKSIIALMFSMSLTCIGMCFADPVYAKPIVIEKVSLYSHSFEAEAVNVFIPGYIPIVSISYETTKDFDHLAILEQPLTLFVASGERYTYRSWQDNYLIGKINKGHRNKITKYGSLKDFNFKLKIKNNAMAKQRRC